MNADRPTIIHPLRVLAYLWALPTTCFGLLFALLAIITGGGVQIRRGAIEVFGGAVTWLLRNLTLMEGGASAMTLGHVILGVDRVMLDVCRDHEHVHVRQAERWGPFFIPAYLLAGLWAALRGGHYYRDNAFEREAYGDA